MAQQRTLVDEAETDELPDAMPSADEPAAPRFACGTREQPAVPRTTFIASARDLEALDDAALTVGREGRIRDLNRVAERLLGVARGALLGAPFERAFAWPATGARPTFDAPELGVQLFDASARLVAVRPDADDVPVEALICPHRAGAWLVIVRRTVPLQPRIDADDLAAIVHDLKNPLATVALESYMLELRVADAMDEAMLRAFTRIRHNLDFVDRLVHDLLDLGSADAGCLELQRRPTELATMLEDAIERSVASRDRARVFIEAPHAIVAELDDLRIQRVIANLVQNALKYSPATSGVIVRLEAPTGCVRISVIDAGPGVPVDEHRALFERYRRASTASGVAGSGLGLYVSRRIVEAHGGMIGVENLRGGGARFYFELPA